MKYLNENNGLIGPQGGPNYGPTVSQLPQNGRSYDIQIPAAVANWVASQAPEVGAIMMESYRTGKPLTLSVRPPLPAPVPATTPRHLQVNGNWLRIISVCKACWPDETANGAATRLAEAAQTYQDRGAYRRDVERGSGPALSCEPEATIYAVLQTNSGARRTFPSQDRIRKKLVEQGWAKSTSK